LGQGEAGRVAIVFTRLAASESQQSCNQPYKERFRDHIAKYNFFGLLKTGLPNCYRVENCMYQLYFQNFLTFFHSSFRESKYKFFCQALSGEDRSSSFSFVDQEPFRFVLINR
jgi:hypothetical protein